MYRIISLIIVAFSAIFADAHEKRYAYPGQNQNLNVQSSSAFSGPYGGGGPGSGSATSGGASAGSSASASSYAGSSSYSGGGGNGGGSFSGSGSPSGSYGQGSSNAGSQPGSYGQGSSNAGSQPGSYGQGSSNAGSQPGSYGQGSSNAFGDKGPSDNAIPNGNFAGNPNYGSSYPVSGSGYAGGYANSYGGGPQDSGFTPGQNLPPGCFSGFGGPNFDPFRIHQEIMNQIQRQHEENLRFGAGLAAQAAQGGQGGAGPQSAFASGHIGPSGGYGAAGISPKEPGSLATRFGDPVPDGPVHSVSGNIPPPSGGTYGISTSSHSVSENVNGVPKTYKESSVTVNDNGKITSYKSHSP